MFVEREKIEKLFELCFDDMTEFEKREFAMFCFTHLYFITCVVGDDGSPVSLQGLMKFRQSITTNLSREDLEYIRRFFREVKDL
ncbi:MAG: hypothetical protein ACTSW7_00895 [Candidatus Thorarchaeota archaeon]|nr:hypothetical protein [Thermoplasmatales archaeon]